MTNNPIPSHADLAAAALPYFDDINSRLTLIAYTDDLACTNETIAATDDLITALDTDIRDLIKNANLADLIPFADDLDDDAYHALSTRLRNDSRFAPLIARRILTANPDLPPA